MAMRDSVTVSIAELTSGTRRRMSRVSWLDVSTWLGMTSDAAGSSSTSSKVRPSMATLSGSSPPVCTCPPVLLMRFGPSMTRRYGAGGWPPARHR